MNAQSKITKNTKNNNNNKNNKKVAAAVVTVNELKRAGANVAGSRRTDTFRDKWQSAMVTIEEEVIGNKGVYPQNEGRLSLAEVARRAGTVVNSLYPARHSDLKTDIEVFVDRMLELSPPKKPVDKPPEPTWEELYRATVTNYRADALLWQADRAQREVAEKLVAKMEQTIAAHLTTIENLTQQLANLTKDRVVPIGARKAGR